MSLQCTIHCNDGTSFELLGQFTPTKSTPSGGLGMTIPRTSSVTWPGRPPWRTTRCPWTWMWFWPQKWQRNCPIFSMATRAQSAPTSSRPSRSPRRPPSPPTRPSWPISWTRNSPSPSTAKYLSTISTRRISPGKIRRIFFVFWNIFNLNSISRYLLDQEDSVVHVSHNVTNYEFFYEPFYVSLDTAPTYDERFVGYGFTRNTQVS